MSDDEERVTKRVVYEQEGTSSSGQNIPVMVVLAVIVIGILVFIFMHLH